MLAPTHEPAASVADDERRVLAARAAALVLGALMFWPVVTTLGAGLQYALLDVPGGALPSYATRAALIGGEAVVRLVVLLLVLRLASHEPRAAPRRMSLLGWIALALLVAAALGAHAASVRLSARIAQAVGSLGAEPLSTWLQETTELSLLQLGLDATALLAGFVYAVVRWQIAAARTRR
ncbi:hypothetical protein SAMN02745121_08681 [Nannocystis exedens]|uniref:DUF4149 domain-containing protein n=1 Tax=Nannocystis exedens TaxID=54 RepID=A0A1I2IFL2_9BACT|nr:hypothetical protein [Nannocystis exedens]PCC73661.1 hypothetical protein NAEX_06749 [Nannocystis exedens]SFF41004.1 hypothetical protein SAMN02745121_08681 [Nannocystis exedens]